MSRLIYQVAVGQPSKLYEHCINSVKDYCDRHDIEHLVQRVPKFWIKPDPFTSNRSDGATRHGCLPIYEKENAFDLLGKYDQIAIVDADIFIRDTAPNIFEELNPSAAFAGVVERSAPILPWYQQKLVNYSRMQYSNLQDVDWLWNADGAEFMNMGLMVLNTGFKEYLDGDSGKEFIMRPEFKRFVDGQGAWKWSTDQTLLNYWIKKRGVPYQRLDWRWNALYTAVTEEALKEAHFIHFFLKDKLPDRGENVDELMGSI